MPKEQRKSLIKDHVFNLNNSVGFFLKTLLFSSLLVFNSVYYTGNKYNICKIITTKLTQAFKKVEDPRRDITKPVFEWLFRFYLHFSS